MAPTSQRFNEPDTCWKFFDETARLEGLGPEEEQARDRMLAQLARGAVIENALQRRRRAALRIFLSRHYPRSEGWARTIYALGLIALPGTFRAARDLVGKVSPQSVALPPVQSSR
jgi:hypothetical protein